jgi:hypothetical protein
VPGSGLVSGEVAFAVEISHECACHPGPREHCAIVAGWRRPGGRVVAELVQPGGYGHPRDAVARVDELYVKHDPVAVVIDGMSQAATLIRPLADVGVVVLLPRPRDVAVAHGEFMDLVNAGALEHLGQDPLTAAVRAAQHRPLAGAQAWERKVPVDQSPLVAATLAVWAFLGWEVLSQPGTYVL